MVWMWHEISNPSPIEGYLNVFQFRVIVNKDIMNIVVKNKELAFWSGYRLSKNGLLGLDKSKDLKDKFVFVDVIWMNSVTSTFCLALLFPSCLTSSGQVNSVSVNSDCFCKELWLTAKAASHSIFCKLLNCMLQAKSTLKKFAPHIASQVLYL
jgi:hypothetical protein